MGVSSSATGSMIDIYPTKPEGKVELGIYKWDGVNKITVCITHPGSAQTRHSQALFQPAVRNDGHLVNVDF
jgi:hypothetical protein